MIKRKKKDYKKTAKALTKKKYFAKLSFSCVYGAAMILGFALSFINPFVLFLVGIFFFAPLTFSFQFAN